MASSPIENLTTVVLQDAGQWREGIGGGGGGGEEISWYVSQCVTSQSKSHDDWPGAPTLQYLISHISVQSRVVLVMWALIMKGPGCHQNKFMNDHMNQTLFSIN